MARPLQKKKNKSSLPRVRQKTKSKRINIKSNPIIAANWDQSLTLSQNYRRLGLSTNLNSTSGGAEACLGSTGKRKAAAQDSLVVGIGAQKRKDAALGTQRVQVLKDEHGAIMSVLRPKVSNPLNDPLNEIEDVQAGNAEEEEESSINRPATDTNVIRQLEQASRLERTKRPRQQSAREIEWIESLVARHGDDIEAMMRDRKLNPMQQSAGQIRRKLEVWRHSHG